MTHPGVLLSQTLNSIKHTPRSFADLFNISYFEIDDAIHNDTPLSDGLIAALIDHPIIDHSLFRTFIPPEKYVGPNSTSLDYYYTSEAESIKSSRVFCRKGTDFYDYKDLAASLCSPILPEHITPLVHACSSEDFTSIPPEFFNKGHLEHQITYFIGDINFHWQSKDGSHNTRQMHHLDRNYITPYVPHTFTTRSSGSYIVAVTFKSLYSSYDKQIYSNEISRVTTNYSLSNNICSPIEFYSNSSIQDPFCFTNHPRAPFTKFHTSDFCANSIKDIRHSWLYVLEGEITCIFDSPNPTSLTLKPGDSVILNNPSNIRSVTSTIGVVEVSLEVYDDNNLPPCELEICQLYSVHGHAIFTRLESDSQAWF